MKPTIFLAALLGLSILGACKHTPQPNMPDFAFLQLNANNVYSRDEVKNDKSTLFIFFNPDCDHCQAEAASMKLYKKEFAQHRIIWVAVSDEDKMNTFDDTYQLSAQGMILLRDVDKKAAKWFAVKDVPTMMVYNKDAELVAKYSGAADAKQLLKDLDR